MRKPLPNALDIDFKGGLTSEVTPHAGIALFIETGRRSRVMAAAEQYVPQKRSAKGLGQGQMVEAFVLLSALGGDCLDDFDGLRRDLGLRALTGYTLPAAATARQWLDRFHEEALLADRPTQGSFIPCESGGLVGLRAVLQFSVRTYVSAVAPGPAVTLDVDAHLVESSKQAALPTYEGFRGYQPLLVSWAETGLVMADEFRDGNVPASVGIKDLVDEAYASLPARADGQPWQVAVRSDSAAYAYEALDHWQERGWRFAVSADMSAALKQAVMALPETAWQMWQQEARGTVREWAEVTYVPSRVPERHDLTPYRYVAIRVRKAQGELFADGNPSKHFAVVSNDWETNGQALLAWQRGKAGTIEHVNRILKDELGAGVYPSGKFGAHAAWLRLQVLTLNLLEALKAVGLDPQYRTARPKRLRFAIFTQFGRVVRHARQVWMRLGTDLLDRLVWPVRGQVARAAWGAP
jgi:Transposase DDE domain group 1